MSSRRQTEAGSRPPSSESERAINNRPEPELLLRCAAARLDPESARQIRILLRGEFDWLHLYGIAFAHGMMPLLYWHLQATCPDSVPEASMDYLRSYFEGRARRNLYLTQELCRILDASEAGGIQVVPYKGPAVAASLYGNLALREFDDLDLLVREPDVLKAKELLVSRGFRPKWDLTRSQEIAYLRHYDEYLFLREEDQVLVEIHWRVVPRFFSFPLDLESLWPRLERLSLGGKQVANLSPEDLLLVLCVHGAKHLWERLGWICDVAELVRAHGRLDWRRVFEQARVLGGERMLFLGLFLASDLLGAPLPVEVAQEARADSVVGRLAVQVRERFFQGVLTPHGIFEKSRFHLRVRERLTDRIRYAVRLATTPTVRDWQCLQLPSYLSPLYYLLRPIRLLVQNARALFERPPLDLARYVPTPPEEIARMLELAQVGPADVVYDLGCGDGRIVILAAQRYGARGVGVDVDPQRIAQAEANSRKAGVEHLVRFLRQDAKAVDVSEATVLTLGLLLGGNLKLRPMLQEQLKPGARIVSRRFDMADWAPVETEVFQCADGTTDTLFLWRIERKIRRSPAASSQ